MAVKRSRKVPGFVFFHISKTVHSQQLKGVQHSKLGT